MVVHEHQNSMLQLKSFSSSALLLTSASFRNHFCRKVSARLIAAKRYITHYTGSRQSSISCNSRPRVRSVRAWLPDGLVARRVALKSTNNRTLLFWRATKNVRDLPGSYRGAFFSVPMEINFFSAVVQCFCFVGSKQLLRTFL